MGKFTFLSKKRVFLGIFLLLMTVFSPQKVNAQDIITLHGSIVNDSLEDSYLHIMNLNLQRGTITNENGAFSIPVRINDTLYISAVQFEHQKIVVTAQIFASKYLNIKLKTAISQLEEVTISNINLSGRLGNDVKKIEVDPYFDQTSVGFAPTAKKRSSELRALEGAGGFGLGGLIDLLSGRKKMLKKIYEISVMEGRVKAAQIRFENRFYREQLHIPEDLIDDFCYFVYENNEEALQLSATGNPLKLTAFLIQKAEIYKNHKAIRD